LLLQSLVAITTANNAANTGFTCALIIIRFLFILAKSANYLAASQWPTNELGRRSTLTRLTQGKHWSFYDGISIY
jgi:hypothetical protein